MQMRIRDAANVMRKLDIAEVECKHHCAGFLVVDGIKVLKVHHSRGDGNMPTTVAHLFRKSLKLSVPHFRLLVGCKLDRAAYVELLRKQGVVPLRAQLR